MFITEAGAGMLKELERIITQSKQSRGNREALGNNVSWSPTQMWSLYTYVAGLWQWMLL